MPFYQYNSFTGSIKPSTNFQPLFPLSSIPLHKVQQIIVHDPNTKLVNVTPKSGYCTDKPPTLDPKMWAKFKHFGAAIDKPVYLAGGKKDKILFGITVAYVGVCTLQSLVFVMKDCLNLI
ncbi:uncharacterized protein [Anoplolepis gracilipes]|uniref:uncharacterized protein n=1 Tax=Anoplolepis gracilipes TaxID=354296 RepID=UPI003BA38228